MDTIKLVEYKDGDPLLDQYYKIRADFKNKEAMAHTEALLSDPHGKPTMISPYPEGPVIQGDKTAKYLLITRDNGGEVPEVLGGLRMHDIGSGENFMLPANKFPNAQRANLFPGVKDNSKFRTMYVDGVLLKTNSDGHMLATPMTANEMLKTMVKHARGQWPKDGQNEKFDMAYFLPKPYMGQMITWLAATAKNDAGEREPLPLYYFGDQTYQARHGTESKPLLGLSFNDELSAHLEDRISRGPLDKAGVEHRVYEQRAPKAQRRVAIRPASERNAGGEGATVQM